MSNLKQGQKVFDYILQEWMTISKINEGYTYPVVTNNAKEYTIEGMYHVDDKLPRLSLTECNPNKGTGKYTPINPEPPVQVGDMVWGYNGEGKMAMYGELTGVRKCHDYPYIVSSADCWRNVSKKRPHWIP